MAKPVEVQITGDASGLFAALHGSGKEIQAFGAKAEGIAGGLTEKFGALGGKVEGVGASFMALGPALVIIAALGGAVLGVVEIFKSSLEHATRYGDELAKASQKAGTTVEALSGLKYAAELAGVEFEALVKGLGKLSVKLQEAAIDPASKAGKTFDSLGISVKGAKGELKDADVVLVELAEKFAGMKDGAGKTALVISLFGKAGAQLIPLLNEGKEGLEKLKAEAKALGLELTGGQARAAEEYEDNLKRMEAAGRGVQIQIGNALIPAVNTLALNLVGLAKDSMPVIISGAKEMASTLVGLVVSVRASIIAISAFQEASSRFVAPVLDFLTGNYDTARASAKVAANEIMGLANGAKSQIETVIREGQNSLSAIYGGSIFGPKKRGGKEEPAIPEKEGKAEKAVQNVFQEEMNRLDKEALAFEEKITLEQKQQAELKKLALTLDEDRARIQKELDKGELTEAEATKARLKASDNFVKGEAAIFQKFADERAKIDAHIEQIHLDALKNTQATEIDIQIAGVKLKEQLGEISAQEALKLEFDLSQKKIQILIDELKAKRELELDAVKQAELDEKISNAQNEKGKGSAAFGGATQLNAANSSFGAGLTLYVNQSLQSLQQWGKMAQAIMGGVENAFASGINGILSGTMTLSQGLKSIWQGIGAAVIGVLAQMAAKWLVTAIAQKVFGIETTLTAEAAAAAQTEASLTAGAAGAWAAYGWIPYVGAALAIAQIVAMEASVAAAGLAAAATGRAVGGLVGQHGPELTMLGEKGLEVVAPENDFKDWAAGFASFGANIARQQDQAHQYDSQGAGFASRASSQDGFGMPPLQISGNMFLGSEAESKRMLQNAVRGALDDYNRVKG